MKFLISLCVLTGWWWAGQGQIPLTDYRIQSIIRHQDLRSPGHTFLPYLSDSDSLIRRRALQALASVQNRGDLALVTDLFQDPSADVRGMAYLAAGQTGDSSALIPMIEALRNDSHPVSRAELGLAIGQVITQRLYLALRDSALLTDPALHARVLFRMATRGPLAPVQIADGNLLLRMSLSPSDHSMVLYALSRGIRSPLPDASLAATLEPWTYDADPLNRNRAIQVFRRFPDSTGLAAARRLITTETDPGVLQAAARVLLSKAAFLDISDAERLKRLTLFPTSWVQVSLAQTLRTTDSTKVTSDAWRRLRSVVYERMALSSPVPGYRDIEWMITACQFGHGPDSLIGRLSTLPNPFLRGFQAVLLGYLPVPGSTARLTELTRASDPAIRTPAAQILTDQIRKGQVDTLTIRAMLRSWLATADLSLVSFASDLLTNPAFRYEGLEPDIGSCFDKTNSADGVEALLGLISLTRQLGTPAAADLLTRWTSHSSPVVARAAREALNQKPGPRPLQQAIPAVDLAGLTGLQKPLFLDWKTSKGTIRMKLLPEEAPMTVLAMLRLVRTGFFNGIYFHRLVPDFVIQGGDPRGDGSGGPGFVLRSEFSQIRYSQAGKVGMASAGKDTEGCQFFIIHSPTPHLDGRYTIWAEVVSGLSVADELEPGDRIESVRVIGE